MIIMTKTFFEKEIQIFCTCAHCDTWQTHREGTFVFTTDNKKVFDKVAHAINTKNGVSFEDKDGNTIFHTDNDNDFEFDFEPVKGKGEIIINKNDGTW